MNAFTHPLGIRSLALAAAFAVLAAAGAASAQERQSASTLEIVQSDPVADAATRSTAQLGISIDDLYFCYGFDEDTNSCTLHLGSRQHCQSLTTSLRSSSTPPRRATCTSARASTRSPTPARPIWAASRSARM